MKRVKNLSSRDRRAQARSRQYKARHPQTGALVLGRGLGPELDVPMAGKVFVKAGWLEFRA